jgi:hypothetical protein
VSDRDSDIDFDAFFRSGEDGTYKGGPADSIAPVYAELEFDDPDDAFYEQHAARQERRERYQRRVFHVVGALAASLVLTVSVRGASAGSSGVTATESTSVRVAAQEPSPPVTANVPSSLADDAPPTTEMPEVVVAANDPPTQEPTLVAEPAAPATHAPVLHLSANVAAVPAPVPVSVPVPVPVLLPAAVPAKPRPQRPKPAASSPPSPPSPSLQSLRNLQVVNAPPTATFPD